MIENTPKVVAQALKNHGLPVTRKNVEKITEITKKALLGNKKSVMPISTLQQRIAVGLGGTGISSPSNHFLRIPFSLKPHTPLPVSAFMNQGVPH